jgi:cyclopropane-fatty-acyl-phospholipid synthase
MRHAPSLDALAARLCEAGANLTLRAPGIDPVAVGARAEATQVRFRSAAAFGRLLRGDLGAATDAYLDGEIDIDGDLREVLKATDVFDLGGGRLAQAAFAVSLRLPGRRARASRTAVHYEQPPEFFLAWFERWRSYSHGLYSTPDDDPAAAQARKMQRAIELLGLRAGMDVFDMGCGWGSFIEYAGLQDIRVHGITLSAAQHEFVARLIRERGLPCTVERVDFHDYRPQRCFDGAVFMGTLEHLPRYPRVATFLDRHLAPGGRVWADFLAHRQSRTYGDFMRRHLWPGVSSYVSLQRVVTALVARGFNVHELADDTASYALTVRDWARRLEARRAELAGRFGERTVRTFLLFLWGSYHFFTTNRTQAYHLVAGRSPAALRRG